MITDTEIRVFHQATLCQIIWRWPLNLWWQRDINSGHKNTAVRQLEDTARPQWKIRYDHNGRYSMTTMEDTAWPQWKIRHGRYSQASPRSYKMLPIKKFSFWAISLVKRDGKKVWLIYRIVAKKLVASQGSISAGIEHTNSKPRKSITGTDDALHSRSTCHSM